MGASSSSSMMMTSTGNPCLTRNEDFNDDAQCCDQSNARDVLSRPPPPGVGGTATTATRGGMTARWIREHEDQIRELVEGAKDTSVKVTLKNLLGLMEGAVGEDAPARQALVDGLSLRGEARKDAVHVLAVVKITVLTDEWCCVPVFPNAVAVTASKVAPASAASHFGVVGEAHCFVSKVPGEHVLEAELLVPYATTRKTGFQLAVPKSARCDLEFSVPVAGVTIKTEPALFSETAVIGADTSTTVRCRVPPTSSISVQWTEKLGSEPAKVASEPVREKAKERVTASVEQLSLASIGDGFLAVCTQLLFTVTSGQMSVFTVELDPRVRVVSVEGLPQIPVKHWEVEKVSTASSFVESDTPESARPKAQILRAILEYGLEDSFELTIVSEMPIEATMPNLRVPNFRVVPDCEAHHITRERGYVAVEARTNVEIREAGSRLLGRSDVSELPEKLWDAFTSSPLLCYKFIEPTGSLHLAIKKHQDAQVLVAAVTEAHIGATITSEGKLMYLMVLHVRNTQRQFLRITAKGTELWSASVDGVPVKPAVDSSGHVMMPLTTSSRGGDGSSPSRVTVVRYACMKELAPMQRSGSQVVDLPSCDVPISHEFVSLYLPEGYRDQPPVSHSSGGLVQAQMMSNMMRRESIDEDSCSEMGGDSAGGAVYGSGTTASIDISLPTTKVVAHFEQLLVMPNEVAETVDVPYVKISKGGVSNQGRCCANIGSCCCCCCSCCEAEVSPL